MADTLGLDILNRADPNTLPDVLRAIYTANGSKTAFGDFLNNLQKAVNALALSATQTLTVGGTAASGAVLTATIGTTNVTYTFSSTDTLATAASGLATAINANATVSASFTAKATAGSAVITLTANTPGSAANATALAGAATSTATLTASNATFGAGGYTATTNPGVGNAPLSLIANGTVNL